MPLLQLPVAALDLLGAGFERFLASNQPVFGALHLGPQIANLGLHLLALGQRLFLRGDQPFTGLLLGLLNDPVGFLAGRDPRIGPAAQKPQQGFQHGVLALSYSSAFFTRR